MRHLFEHMRFWFKKLHVYFYLKLFLSLIGRRTSSTFLDQVSYLHFQYIFSVRSFGETFLC